MNDVIVYRPYQSHAWFAPFVQGMGILAFIWIGYCLPDVSFSILFWFVIGIVCFLLSKKLYDSSNLTIFFEENGLRITGSKRSSYNYFPWKNFTYAYYSKSCKGHIFLVLSSQVLTQKQVKQIVNQGANSSRAIVDFAVVIYIDSMQDTSQIKELIKREIAQ